VTSTRKDIVQPSANPRQQEHEARPQWLKDRLEWFLDLKFGLFMHWGPYCQWGCIESWPLVPADTWARPDDLPAWTERKPDVARFQRDYWALNQTFEPTGYDPTAWADLAERAGMKYVCFTTKHHDGFCMWDTATTDYRVTHPSCPFHSDPRADIVREVFRTFRERDFAVSCYFSKSDWHSPHYWWPGAPAVDRNPNYDTLAHPERWQGFVDFVHAQVRELMTDYGPIDALWLDGGQVRPPKQDIRMADMAAMARELQPGLIVADRTVGGEFENIVTPEQRVPEAPLGYPWESCLTMGNGWAYRPHDEYKSTRTLIHLLVDIVAKGGNLLLNVGPDPVGNFDPIAVQRLTEIGNWMAVNAEAIHGTRPVAPYKSGNVCFTRKGNRVFALVLAEGDDALPGALIRWEGIRPAPGSTMRLLGGTDAIPWAANDGGVTLSLPTDLPCEHAWVLEFGI
jgi:alpha-L-fucosidase